MFWRRTLRFRNAIKQKIKVYDLIYSWHRAQLAPAQPLTSVSFNHGFEVRAVFTFLS